MCYLYYNYSCKVSDEDHPAIACSLITLAKLLKAQGNKIERRSSSIAMAKYEEAEPLYRRSIAIRRVVCTLYLFTSYLDYSLQDIGRRASGCGKFDQQPSGVAGGEI
jgi:hypothetical protein